jgi:hypothetical protein
VCIAADLSAVRLLGLPAAAPTGLPRAPLSHITAASHCGSLAHGRVLLILSLYHAVSWLVMMSNCPSCRAACILLARGAFASGLKNSQLYSESALPAITGKRDKIMSDKKTMSHGNIYCTAIKMKRSSIVSRMSLYEFWKKNSFFYSYSALSRGRYGFYSPLAFFFIRLQINSTHPPISPISPPTYLQDLYHIVNPRGT